MLTFLSPDEQKSPGATNQQNKNGFLVVEVLHTDETPISLAAVMIYSENKGELVTHKVLQTGINGKTEPICFHFIDQNIIICSGIPIASPANFFIRVEYGGYYTNIYKNAHVVPDMLAIQTSYMIPLAFGMKNTPGLEKIYEALVRPVTKL